MEGKERREMMEEWEKKVYEILYKDERRKPPYEEPDNSKLVIDLLPLDVVKEIIRAIDEGNYREEEGICMLCLPHNYSKVAPWRTGTLGSWSECYVVGENLFVCSHCEEYLRERLRKKFEVE